MTSVEVRITKYVAVAGLCYMLGICLVVMLAKDPREQPSSGVRLEVVQYDGHQYVVMNKKAFVHSPNCPCGKQQ